MLQNNVFIMLVMLIDFWFVCYWLLRVTVYMVFNLLVNLLIARCNKRSLQAPKSVYPKTKHAIYSYLSVAAAYDISLVKYFQNCMSKKLGNIFI